MHKNVPASHVHPDVIRCLIEATREPLDPHNPDGARGLRIPSDASGADLSELHGYSLTNHDGWLSVEGVFARDLILSDRINQTEPPTEADIDDFAAEINAAIEIAARRADCSVQVLAATPQRVMASLCEILPGAQKAASRRAFVLTNGVKLRVTPIGSDEILGLSGVVVFAPDVLPECRAALEFNVSMIERRAEAR